MGAHLRHPGRDEALARAQTVSAACRPGRPARCACTGLTVSGRKRLELARALATEPTLLLLDEVLAGLNPSEVRDIVPVILSTRDSGVSILMVEHVMQAVMSLCDHVFVLAQGRIIAEGAPAQVTQRSRRHRSLSRPRAAAHAGNAGDAAWRSDQALLLLRISGSRGYGETQVLRGIEFDDRARRDRRRARRERRRQVHAQRDALGRHPCAGRRDPFRRPAIDGASTPPAIVERGLIHVPEGRRVFPDLSVRENLELGSYRRGKPTGRGICERVFAIFPRLRERSRRRAGTLSGGEQQMLAIGRGLMAEPKLLILDEPSLGLSPLLVEEMFALIERINADGVSILLVEQNVVQSLALADRAYILAEGKFVMSGSAKDIGANPELEEAYLGM